jgi:hypothetical protein
MNPCIGKKNPLTTTPIPSTTNPDVLPDFECDVSHPCPDNWCCFWDSKECINQALVGNCNVFSTTTTTTTTTTPRTTTPTTTTTNGDVLPDFECDASHPCPDNWCCFWDEKECINEAAVGDCSIFSTTPRTTTIPTTISTTTTTNGHVLPDFECDASHPCPDGWCCYWETKECILEASVGDCSIFSTTPRTTTIPTTIPTTTTTNGHVLPDFECDASHPCPDGWCCYWETKECILEASVGDCSIFSTTPRTTTIPTTIPTTTSTTTTVILPQFGCNEEFPCPDGFCCAYDTQECLPEESVDSTSCGGQLP